jgi:hypothetical protein
MQPDAGALQFTLLGEGEGEGEGAGAGEGEGGGGAPPPPLTAAVTPLGAAPLGHGGAPLPAFLIRLSRGGAFVAAGSLERDEGGGEGSARLWCHVAAGGGGVASLGEPGAALLRAGVVFSSLGAREGWGTEVTVFPADPGGVVRHGFLGGAPPGAPPPRGIAHAPPAPGSYRLRLPAPAFGAGAKAGAAGAGGSFPVATPMPGKVVKVLVQQGGAARPPPPLARRFSPLAYPPYTPSPAQATRWRWGSRLSSWKQ